MVCDNREAREMRRFFPSQCQQQSVPIDKVAFQLHSRHELLPILVALQHLYCQRDHCQTLLELIAQDVNGQSQANRGRPGLSYWEIIVLAGVRLGCNCDYDALQDLAENHRTLRQILGVADQPLDPQQPSPYAWHRLRDNLCLLQPRTLEQINHFLVRVGHELEPTAAEHVRGDSFVVETNIHYPTEAHLLCDGLRKLLDLALELVRDLALPIWQQGYWRQQLKKQLRYVNRACRSKGKKGPELQRRAYEGLYQLTEQLLSKGQELEQQVQQALAASTVPDAVLSVKHKQLAEFLAMTNQVLGYSRRRVLHGEKIPHQEKLFSMFEPHTQLINRGKRPHPIQFGHSVLVVEDAVGYICHYRILENTEIDETVVVAETKKVKERLPNVKSASFDSGFHTPENQQELSTFIGTVCIPMPGAKQAKKQHEEATAAFRTARQAHPGVEALIGVLQRSNGLKRCRDRGQLGYQRYVGLAVLGHNLQVLGKRLLRQQDADCLAAKSKRKAWTAAA
jgi:transposase, IS5 family